MPAGSHSQTNLIGCLFLTAALCLSNITHAAAQSVTGIAHDENGGPLPGVSVELRPATAPHNAATENATPRTAVTDEQGRFAFDRVASGHYQVSFTLINFATLRREIDLPAPSAASPASPAGPASPASPASAAATASSADSAAASSPASPAAARLAGSADPAGPAVAAAPEATVHVDAALHLSLSADVTVTGKRTFGNLADVENPAENLVGIAQSASQGAITARQLDARPIMRSGEVLETVPGVIISQHSGEGKANQYYLRGFNLDHGTDFATTVAGMPVNMPTHGHGQGYSDLNFLIPELVSGVQYAKGPYFAEQGDFATAGSANINYASTLDHPLIRVTGGSAGFARALFAASPSLSPNSHLLAAVELEHNDGPWVNPDNYKKLNGVLRYSTGDTVNGLTLTAMGYHATWNATDQVPQRAMDSGEIPRFGAIDPTDGGNTYRGSASVEWQRSRNNASLKVVGYGILDDLNLFSNFTYALDDPIHGDQFQQVDHRVVLGGKVTYRRLGHLRGREVQNTLGLQIRNDDITKVGLYHTEARQILDTVRQDAVLETTSGLFAQNEIAWTPWLRTLAGVRLDAYRFRVDASDPANGGTKNAAIASPKGGIVIGPFAGTELYANAGTGFHSNDARGATITRDPVTGAPVSPVTPLVRAKGAETGLRTVAVPHLQSSLTLWSLSVDSELVFAGDAGTTEPSRPSHRYGLEWANYYAPRPWLMFDGDVAWSHARFTTADPVGDRIPGAAETVLSAGATLDSLHNVYGSIRLRYFGPRPLIENNSVRSKPTGLINLEAGYRLAKNVKLGIDVYNVLNAKDSDIDYYYTSRLPGEPADGVSDIHMHPTLPRTARVSLILGF